MPCVAALGASCPYLGVQWAEQSFLEGLGYILLLTRCSINIEFDLHK